LRHMHCPGKTQGAGRADSVVGQLLLREYGVKLPGAQERYFDQVHSGPSGRFYRGPAAFRVPIRYPYERMSAKDRHSFAPLYRRVSTEWATLDGTDGAVRGVYLLLGIGFGQQLDRRGDETIHRLALQRKDRQTRGY